MSEFWQKTFLTIGIVIAVFGMRLVFPLVIVWLASGLGPLAALELALNPPADGASHFAIAAFGGMFLLMLFLGFVLEEREITWLSWIE